MSKNITKKHNTELGLKTPKNYFSASKNSILEQVSTKDSNKSTIFNKNRNLWLIAASISILISILFFKTKLNTKINQNQTVIVDTIQKLKKEKIINNIVTKPDNILIASLFIDDNKVDDYIDNSLINEIIKTETIKK